MSLKNPFMKVWFIDVSNLIKNYTKSLHQTVERDNEANSDLWTTI